MNKRSFQAGCLAGACTLLLLGCGGGNDDSHTPEPLAPAQAAAAADDYSLDWNAAKTLSVQANDQSSGGTAVLSVLEQPKYGSVSVAGQELVYTPNPGFFGEDSLRYKLAVSSADMSSSAQSEAVVKLKVEASLTLAGVVTDGPIAKARVTAALGEQPSVSVDANERGEYSLALKTSKPTDFLTLSASGIGPQSQVMLSSLAGEVAGLAQRATAGKLTGAEAPALRITHLSTALAGLLVQASADGKAPTSDKGLSEAAAKLNPDDVLDAAALIQLVVDHGVALPAEANNTQQLAAAAATLASFASAQRKDNGPQFEATRAALLNDAALQQAPPLPASTGTAGVTLIYAYGIGGSSKSAYVFNLQPDGSAEVVSDRVSKAKWTRAGSRVMVTIDSPELEDGGYSAEVGPDGLQWTIQVATTGYTLTDMAAGSARYSLATLAVAGYRIAAGGPKAGLREEDEAQAFAIRRYADEALEGFTPEDFAMGVRWAGPIAAPTTIEQRRAGVSTQDMLSITGADSAEMERGGLKVGWKLVGGALELSLPDANYRYRRMGKGPLGEEHWLMEQRVGGKLLAASEIMAVKASPVSLDAAALAKRWSGNLNAHLRYGSFYSLRADGMSAISGSGIDQPESERFYSRFWALQADGRLYMARGTNPQGQPCMPTAAAPSCKAQGSERYWRFVAQQGKTLYLIEQLQFSAQDPSNISYRFVAMTDVGEPK
ncbi:Ig-like domain-containing protein [Roseateles sp.]|uniref:Ig-like domain-containing protein n=1 Tax=Roseateles sp. TaxID=1971397 RepID=UPI00286C4B5A|nr:Ig-like domain-containing protein [Roseateles sp.]